MRMKWLHLLCVAAACALLPAQAMAAAEVKRLSLVLSGVPSSIAADDINDRIDTINKTQLEPAGLKGLEDFSFAWYFQAELRYFVRPNVAISAGYGTLQQEVAQEYLPSISSSVNLLVKVESAAMHAGAAYYMAPYNQGDFQARAYVGGGFMSLINSNASFDTQASFPGGFFHENQEGTGSSPGYYLETGAHMFFASRYSVLLGVLYRSAVIRDLYGVRQVEQTGQPDFESEGVTPTDLDVSGVGFRMGVAIGF